MCLLALPSFLYQLRKLPLQLMLLETGHKDAEPRGLQETGDRMRSEW